MTRKSVSVFLKTTLQWLIGSVKAPYKTSDKTSFAYVSARDRWPVILVSAEPCVENACLQGQTGAIDDVHRAVVACEDESKRNEGKSIVEGLAKLKYELQHNRALTYVES